MAQKLMTAKQQEKARRDAAIKSDFAKMKGQYPDAPDWRICSVLAQRYRLTTMTIRSITK